MLRIRHTFLAITAAAFGLCACSPPEPLHLGYLGGLSGRVTDLGIGGLNGVKLAVEQRNAAGGIKGRPIELIEADDQQEAESARKAMTRLIGFKVAAVIGPMTSAMAIAAVPLANQAHVVMISPTATTADLSGLDDYFFRVIPATSSFVKTSAEHHFNTLGLRRLRLVYDLRNRSYTESWLKDFNQTFAAAGGTLLAPVSFSSSDELDFAGLARNALADKPEGLIILANSVDAAMLSQSIRKLNAKIPLGTSEWAATERLIELGGKDVEGISVAQFHDRNAKQPVYQAFRQAYVSRFKQEPGFAGLFAFDAANVVFEALENKSTGQSLKDKLLSQGSFSGTQRRITFDRNGDTQGETFIVSIQNGAYVPLPATR
jgi:branched-chain amino acid transport system substrate-binding protein